MYVGEWRGAGWQHCNYKLHCHVSVSTPVLNKWTFVLASEFTATSNLKRKHDDDPYVLLTYA
jgi:hypothetical protein